MLQDINPTTIGTFAELESRSGCSFCSFVVNVSLLFLREELIQHMRNSSSPIEILSGSPFWPQFWPFPRFTFVPLSASLRAPIHGENDEAQYHTFPDVVMSLVQNSSAELINFRQRTEKEVLRGELDIGLIKSWLNTCITSHNTCQQQSTGTKPTTLVRPNFIDVTTNEIVHSIGNWDYVSLSYVWGRPDKKMVLEKLEVEPRPKSSARGSQKQAGSVITRVYVDRPCRVIRDALELTKRLCYRYLWVDEYCIPADARQRQMQLTRWTRSTKAQCSQYVRCLERTNT
jgi:hypothetical protein